MKQTAVQLCELNQDNFPISIASGCLIWLNGKKLLLSVEHATGNDGKWAIQMGYDKTLGAKNYLLGEMNFIMSLNVKSGDLSTIDFSYVELPEDVRPTRHIVDIHGDTLSNEEVTVFMEPFDVQPNIGEEFSFEGAVKPTTYANLFNQNHTIFDLELLTYDGITYLRREDDFLIFKLPFDQHPGHEWFKGCSGAPILNQAGYPVGLIAGGDTDTNEISGVALDTLIKVVEATLY